MYCIVKLVISINMAWLEITPSIMFNWFVTFCPIFLTNLFFTCGLTPGFTNRYSF